MRRSCIGAVAQKLEAHRPHIKSIEDFAEQTQENNEEDIIPQIPNLSTTDIVIEIHACTSLQSSMLTRTLGSNGTLYVHHHAVRLARHIDLFMLKQAWKCLVRKTETLRTTFHFSKVINSWVAAVHQESRDAWVEYNIRAPLSESLTDIANYHVFHAEADFEQPPWKTTVLKTATEFVLVISMHHSLYDGESIDLIFQDLAKLYQDIQLPPRAPFSVAARAISKTTENADDF